MWKTFKFCPFNISSIDCVYLESIPVLPLQWRSILLRLDPFHTTESVLAYIICFQIGVIIVHCMGFQIHAYIWINLLLLWSEYMWISVCPCYYISRHSTDSLLGDKGCALRTVGKGVYKGPNPSPLDKRITDRRARIRNLRALHCCILSSRG